MPPSSPPPRKPVGPQVGIAIIILLLFGGALYYWGMSFGSDRSPELLPLIEGDSATVE